MYKEKLSYQNKSVRSPTQSHLAEQNFPTIPDTAE